MQKVLRNKPKIDLGKIRNVKELELAQQAKVVCYDCDGSGYDDFAEAACDTCAGSGVIQMKYCRGCGEWKLPENFYGQEKKQSRCIPCYKVKYFGEYRRNLRKAKA